MRRPAKSPCGLRNTEPQLGNPSGCAALRRASMLLDCVHRARFVVLEAERAAEEPLGRGPAHRPIVDLEVGPRPVAHVAAAIDRRHALDMRPRLAAERARVHRERAADRAGYAGEERRGTQMPAHATLGEQHAGEPGARADTLVVEPLELARQAAGRNHGAADAAVAHQQIRAQPQPMDRGRGRQLRENARELGDGGRRIEQIRRTADAPRRVLAQRLVAQRVDCRSLRSARRSLLPPDRRGRRQRAGQQRRDGADAARTERQHDIVGLEDLAEHSAAARSGLR